MLVLTQKMHKTNSRKGTALHCIRQLQFFHEIFFANTFAKDVRVHVVLLQEFSSTSNTGESVVLKDLADDYEPTEDEILEYAKWLGMDPDKDATLFWIARQGLKAPLPENWKPCRTVEHEVYYFNFATGESVWDHPCDEVYRSLYHEELIKKQNYEEKVKKTEDAQKKHKVCT